MMPSCGINIKVKDILHIIRTDDIDMIILVSSLYKSTDEDMYYTHKKCTCSNWANQMVCFKEWEDYNVTSIRYAYAPNTAYKNKFVIVIERPVA